MRGEEWFEPVVADGSVVRCKECGKHSTLHAATMAISPAIRRLLQHWGGCPVAEEERKGKTCTT